MNSALVLLASISVAFAGLAGVVPNLAATIASREDRFDIVTINPSTGAASSTQKQIFAPYDGVLDFSNIVFSANGQVVLSLQGYDYSLVTGNQGSTPLVNMGSNPINPWNNPAYLARQDLAQGGRYEYCALSQAVGASQPINIFWDSPTSVVATAVGNGVFSIVRYSFVEANTMCAAAIIGQIPSANGVTPNIKASRGSNIYFVTEPFGGFASSQTAQIRAYSVSASAATPLFNNGFVTLPANIFPASLVALSDELVSFQAWNAALSGTTAGFGTYEVNLRTYVSGTALVARSIASNNEELSYAQTFLNQTGSLFSIKNAPTTTLSVQPFLASTSYAQATSAEVRQTTAINTNNIFFLFDLANATLATIDADASTTVNTVIVTGTATFAGVITGATAPTGSIAATTASRCRITFTNAGATTATTTTVNAIGQGNGVACTLTALPATAGIAVDVEFAADGVNYNNKISYTHNGVASALRFAQSAGYTLRDATPVEVGGQPISVELLDAAGRKILFPTATTAVTITAQGTGSAVLRGIVGNTATATNGRAVFPYLAIDVDAADNDGIARVVLTASFAGSSSSATLLVNIRLIKRTSSTLAAIAFPTVASGSQAFETQLLDPRDSSKNQRINSRSLSDSTGTIALGLSAYDNDNKVLNTVEVTSTNLVILNGVVLGGSGTKGTGACILPSTTSTSLNDAPSAIWYERTNADLSVDFLALVTVVDPTLGQGRRLVRYNRLAGSLGTSRCTFSEIDRLPIFDNALSNQHTVLLTDGRIAFVEPDFYFPTVTASTMIGSSLLNVWRISTPTVAGAWLIRNKVLSGFQIIGVTQSATNELAINGQSVPAAKAGVWLVDISSQNSPIVAPSTSIAFPQVSTDFAAAATSSEQAFFLTAGSANSFADNRYRYTASVTSAGVQQLNTVHLERATTGMVPENARVIENAGRNYVDFFTLDDAVITSLSPAQVAISNAATITATANNVITGPQLKCRYTSAGVAQPVEYVVSATASVSVAVDATSVNCGPIPTAFIGADRWVYVQISNDNGLNYGPEGKLAVGNPVIPTNIAGTTVTGTTSTATTTATFAVHLESDSNSCPVTTAQLQSVTTAVDTILAQFNNVVRSAITTSCLSTSANGVAYDFTVTATTTTSRLAALQVAASLAALQAAFDARGVNAALLSAAGIVRSTVALGSSTGTISSNKLSNGAIAGIVIACVVGGLAIFGAIGFAIVKAGGAKKQAPSTYAARDVVRADSGASSSSDYDSDYSDYSDDDYSDYV